MACSMTLQTQFWNNPNEVSPRIVASAVDSKLVCDPSLNSQILVGNQFDVLDSVTSIVVLIKLDGQVDLVKLEAIIYVTDDLLLWVTHGAVLVKVQNVRISVIEIVPWG